MTWYQQQVITLKRDVYPQEYLVEQVMRAKLFMDRHFASGLSLGAIAGEAHFSKYHFIRLFKLVYGLTPHQYLVSVRMEKAKELLQSGAGIKETCFLVGFCSTTSFAGLFKKTTGASPSDFLHRKRNNKIAQF